MSNHRLAKEFGVPAQRIGEILAGKRATIADADLRLCCFFGLSDDWWLRLRADYDTQVARTEPREDAREDQTVEGSSRADCGCVLMRCVRASGS